jgi:hypothetical protein
MIVSDSLKNVIRSVLIYEAIIVQCGYECVSEEIIRKHNLPHKRYDSDIKLTEEEFLRMQKELQEEMERLNRENE